MTGRPSSFTPEVGNEICGRIACGESLKAIVRSEAMPDERTVFRWLKDNEDFRQQYTRARVEQADASADRIEELAEKVADGKLDPQAGRVAIDALKWSAGKRNPKKYGERVTTELQALDAQGKPANLSVAVEFIGHGHVTPADKNSNP